MYTVPSLYLQLNFIQNGCVWISEVLLYMYVCVFRNTTMYDNCKHNVTALMYAKKFKTYVFSFYQFNFQS